MYSGRPGAARRPRGALRSDAVSQQPLSSTHVSAASQRAPPPASKHSRQASTSAPPSVQAVSSLQQASARQRSSASSPVLKPESQIPS